MDEIASLLFFISVSTISGQRLVADFQSGGVRGKVTLEQRTSGSSPRGLRIRFSMTNSPGSGAYFAIHETPADYSSSTPCASVGPEIPNTRARYSSSEISTSSSINMHTYNGIAGRSIVLKSSNSATARIVTCGNLRQDRNEIRTFVARFTVGIGGTIYFRENGGSTSIYSSLYSTQRGTNRQLGWNIRSGAVNDNNVNNRCSALRNEYHPTNPSGSCSRTNHRGCHVGALESKHGEIAIGTDRMFLDLNLPLSGSGSIVNRVVTLTDGINVVACAMITLLPVKRAVVDFSHKGATGNIDFAQATPLDPTTIDFRLNGLQRSVTNYLIHQYPVSQEETAGNNRCHKNSVGNLYNPLGVTSKTLGGGTNEEYTVGDIGKKYGIINSRTSLINEYKDWNLPLYGVNSIVGRSFVIFKGSTPWICSNIAFPPNVTVKTAVAEFKYPVIGKIIFQQASLGDWPETTVYVDLKYSDGTSASMGHNWAIHTNTVGADFIASSAGNRCLNLGQRYNPMRIEIDNQCSKSTQDGCEDGDLAGKLGQLIIHSVTRRKLVFTDTTLSMSGPFSIIGRSLLIRRLIGNSNLACANIYRLEELEAEIAGFPGSQINGYVRFTQMSPFQPMEMQIQLSGLSRQAGEYQIHESPVMPGLDCTMENIGGVFDPYGQTSNRASSTGTPDEYKVGDLSGKFGSLVNKYSIPQTVFPDTNSSMTGPASILGRSLVIYRSSTNNPMACANITITTPGAVQHSVRVAYDTDDIIGHISMEQTQFPSGRTSDTTVYVDITWKRVTTTRKIIMNIHSNEVVDNSCANKGTKYNPFRASTSRGYSDCSETNHKRCMVGDVTRKIGQYDLGAGSKVYTDANLPLIGRFSVVGRTFVLTYAGLGRPLACASIYPSSAPSERIFIAEPVSFDKGVYENSIADGLRTDRRNIIVEVTQRGYYEGGKPCATIIIHIAGPDANSKKRLVRTLVTSPSIVGRHTKVVSCTGTRDGQSTYPPTVIGPTAIPGQNLDGVAIFTNGGLQGHLELTKQANDLKLLFRITSLPTGAVGQYRYQLRMFPIIPGVASPCDDDALGARVVNAFEGLLQNSTVIVERRVSLEGENSIIGHSILIQHQNDASKRGCATIVPGGSIRTAIAEFPIGVGGQVVFRQFATDPTVVTSVYSDLFSLNSARSMERYQWKIYDNGVNYVDDASRCSRLGTIFNPDASGMACTEAAPQDCAVGELSVKLGDTQVGVAKGTARQRFIDIKLPLSGIMSILGKSLVLLDQSNRIVACATINSYEERTAQATIKHAGVTGNVLFKQYSPYDPTEVRIIMNNLRGMATKYALHPLPTIPRVTADANPCSNAAIGEIWNPFTVNQYSSPSVGLGTADQYRVGDLTGKYGQLPNQVNNIDIGQLDYNLQLFGNGSAIGRSFVTYRGNEGWFCSNIESTERYVTGIATFVYPVIGKMVFKQKESDPSAPTMIYVELDYSDGSNPSEFHNWHVHIGKVGEDYNAPLNDRCKIVGGHYNPLNVSMFGNYISDCKKDNPTRCELGDLSGKHGSIDIRTNFNQASRYYFSDVNLPLSGPRSILGRSIVIHESNAGSKRLVCADILYRPEGRVSIDPWPQSPVVGYFRFRQQTQFDITFVDIGLRGLSNEAGGFHIHEYPVPKDGSCSAEAVGGHFNPFNVNSAQGPSPGTGTPDEYEVGDLGGKFGSLANRNDFQLNSENDTNLWLLGPLSIVGRSVVIHRTAGDRWLCANLSEDTSLSQGNTFRARATFVSNDVWGVIYLTQVSYPDGLLSDTNVFIDVKHADGRETRGHNWHVHTNGLNFTKECSSAGGHYNPFQVNVDTNYAECSPSNPLRCEVGDQAKKLASYNIGGGKRVFTDVNLPLIGNFSVIGRSFVIHAENGGAERIACATILTAEGPTYDLNITDPNPLDIDDFLTTISGLLNTPKWTCSVAILEPTYDPDVPCVMMRIHFAGKQAGHLKDAFARMVLENVTVLGLYMPKETCGAMGAHTMSLLSIMMCLLLNWLMKS